MNKVKAHSFVLISSLLWGLTFPLSKFALNFLAPEQVSFFRYFFAAIILIGYVLLTKKSLKVTKKQLYMIVSTGFLAFFCYAYFEVLAISHISSGVVSLFIGIIPVITITIEVLLRRRKLKPRTVLVILLAMIGVYLVIKQELTLGGDIRGYIYMTLAISAWIIYLFKAVEIDLDPIVVIAYQFGFVAIIYLGLFILKLDTPMTLNTQVVSVLVYLSVVSTVICYVLYYLAARFLGAGIVSLYDNLVFIVGFISSAIFFQETLNPTVWISFVLILSSVALSLTLDVQKH